jgi:hypothetical protein
MGWRFGTDDPTGLLARYGWQGEVKQPDEEAFKYDSQRFLAKPSGRPASTGGYFVVAQRAS